MKVTDYIVDFLVNEKIEYVFGLTGGAVVHLFDSVARNPKIRTVFTHHEQAAAFAAEAYARISGNLGVAFFTTGPGGTNAITGVAGAWLDSVPCIYISGQARLAHTTHNKPIRQIGTQQLDIIPLVKPITKYAVMVDDPRKIKYHIQKAIWLAKNGRPGPVWLDIPLDIQWQQIEPKRLPGFNPVPIRNEEGTKIFSSGIDKCFNYLAKAKRPLIVVGYGVKLAKAEIKTKELVRRFKIPVVFTWNTLDLLPSSDKLNIGNLGIQGQRGANLAVQNSDLLICLGSHLSLALTGTLNNAFAREAKIIMVDIDENESGYCTVKPDLLIKTDIKRFLTALLMGKKCLKGLNISGWRDKCYQYKARYNKIESVLMRKSSKIEAYSFIHSFSECLSDSDVMVVDGGGTVTQFAFQALRLKNRQRLIISAGLCAMGSGLPEAIGACFANQKNQVICLCGDGSMQLNIQELQTIVHHRLPVKVFVFNNSGYLAIRNTQKAFLEGRYIGSDSQGGVSLPDYIKVSRAYGIKAFRIDSNNQIKQKIKLVLENKGPVVCEVMLSRDQEIMPRVGYDKNQQGANVPRPLEDMFPYLSRKEFKQLMEIRHRYR